MKLRGGEFSTGTTGIFQPELTLVSARLSAVPKTPVDKRVFNP